MNIGLIKVASVLIALTLLVLPAMGEQDSFNATNVSEVVVNAPPPDEQKTVKEPGFAAVFTIAGLLAVAYLVLRKRE